MSSRTKVLSLYKKLNRIAREVMDQDNMAIQKFKQKIQHEFRKNKDLTNQQEIDEKMKIGNDVGEILKKQVVQIVKKPEINTYELKIRKTTEKLDNTIFQENAILPPMRSKKCKDPS